MKKILFINACVRDDSRTKIIAEHALKRLSGEVEEVILQQENIPALDKNALEKREAALKNKSEDISIFRYAKQFAKADIIVFAAPYWDLSFPALLKNYFEAINIPEITFRYGEDGRPQGLCRAKEMYYITTAGGPIISDEFGFGYAKALCSLFYETEKTYYIKAEGLDIQGADTDAIIKKALADVDSIIK